MNMYIKLLGELSESQTLFSRSGITSDVTTYQQIVSGIVAIVRWFNAATRNKESSLEILDKRYAKGEISKGDYDMRKEEVEGDKD
mgnify:CR=1 FL=1